MPDSVYVGPFARVLGGNVTGTARIATFYPPGFFEAGQALSGNARLYGDVEYRGPGLNRNAGELFGYVGATTQSRVIADVTPPPPYAWRP